MLFLAAKNDPVAPAGLIWDDVFCGGKSRGREAGHPILLAVTEEGGHSMVWPEGIDGSGNWSAEVIAEFFAACPHRT